MNYPTQEDYDVDHAVCPSCAKECEETTDTPRSEATATCLGCGWKGSVNDLVADKSTTTTCSECGKDVDISVTDLNDEMEPVCPKCYLGDD